MAWRPISIGRGGTSQQRRNPWPVPRIKGYHGGGNKLGPSSGVGSALGLAASAGFARLRGVGFDGGGTNCGPSDACFIDVEEVNRGPGCVVVTTGGEASGGSFVSRAGGSFFFALR